MAVVGQVMPANQVPAVVLQGNLRGVHLQPPERMAVGGPGPTRPRGMAWGWARKARELLLKWEHLFAHSDLYLGRTALIKHQIEVTDQMLLKKHYWCIPHYMYDSVKAHLQEMLDIGVIWKLHSPWVSAVVLVKKDSSLRFCIDLRKLNNQIIKDMYSQTYIDKTLDSLQGSQWFSSLDLKLGYWQVKMDEESKPLTAFSIGPLGFYECTRMPFWLTNAPATFHGLMETCLGDLSFHWCIIYLDDIVISSKDPASHWCSGNWKRLDLKLKPSKCELFWWQIAYLGHIVFAQGIATDEGKIEAIKKWPVLTNDNEVWSFLGFKGYYCYFIPKFAQVTQPLHELTSGVNAGKKKATIRWSDNCQQAFDYLKRLCTTMPILACVDFTHHFKLHTDACGSGLGAVLCQTHEDGTEPAIAYASRSLTKAKPHTQLEFLVLKWAVVEKLHWQQPINICPHNCQAGCSESLMGGQLGQLQFLTILLSM